MGHFGYKLGDPPQIESEGISISSCGGACLLRAPCLLRQSSKWSSLFGTSWIFFMYQMGCGTLSWIRWVTRDITHVSSPPCRSR